MQRSTMSLPTSPLPSFLLKWPTSDETVKISNKSPNLARSKWYGTRPNSIMSPRVWLKTSSMRESYHIAPSFMRVSSCPRVQDDGRHHSPYRLRASGRSYERQQAALVPTPPVSFTTTGRYDYPITCVSCPLPSISSTTARKDETLGDRALKMIRFSHR